MIQVPESHDMHEENEVIPTIRKKAEAGFIKRVIFLLLSVITIGFWSRFFTVSGNKGTWGVTVFFLVLLTTFLVSERLFKQPINSWISNNYPQHNIAIPDLPGFLFGASGVAPKGNPVAGNKNSNASQYKNDAEIDQLKIMLKEVQSRNAALLAKKSEVILPRISLSSLEEASTEVGCHSRYSIEKKVDVFNDKYKGKWLRWLGKVSHADKEKVTIVSATHEGASLTAMLKRKGEAYEQLKGDLVNVTMLLTGKGSCSKPFTGEKAFLNSIIKVNK